MANPHTIIQLEMDKIAKNDRMLDWIKQFGSQVTNPEVSPGNLRFGIHTASSVTGYDEVEYALRREIANQLGSLIEIIKTKALDEIEKSRDRIREHVNHGAWPLNQRPSDG